MSSIIWNFDLEKTSVFIYLKILHIFILQWVKLSSVSHSLKILFPVSQLTSSNIAVELQFYQAVAALIFLTSSPYMPCTFSLFVFLLRLLVCFECFFSVILPSHNRTIFLHEGFLIHPFLYILSLSLLIPQLFVPILYGILSALHYSYIYIFLSKQIMCTTGTGSLSLLLILCNSQLPITVPCLQWGLSGV